MKTVLWWPFDPRRILGFFVCLLRGHTWLLERRTLLDVIEAKYSRSLGVPAVAPLAVPIFSCCGRCGVHGFTWW